MKLSIVIINYNVKHFLEQCLYSVEKAMKGIEGEVFVVDNNSVDGSCQMVRQKFPSVRLIENHQNLGFSKANNQAIRLSSGEHVLLLNPDTVVEERTFQKVLAYMDENPDVGGMGVKMIDGTGNFLPESKRGLPVPSVAFYKIFGISGLFPKSKIFGRYHLGFLDKEKVHEVDVLPGAFMLLRKSVLDKIGLLDESFFMYGEDIDLSYRITLAGYKNVYFPETTIIHYKGESTKKGSINYVRVFYNAMIIFARKHFTGKNAALLILLIQTAIYFRAFLAVINRLVKTIALPLVDGFMLYAAFRFILPFWEAYKFGGEGRYPTFFIQYILPLYILIWIISIFFSGGYDKPIKIKKVLKGISIGTVVILLIYSLLPVHLRFSRALILIGTLLAYFVTMADRVLASSILPFPGFKLYRKKKMRILVVGGKEECQRVHELIDQIGLGYEFVRYASPGPNTDPDFFAGEIDQIRELTLINKIDEIIFSATDISSRRIIKLMLELTDVSTDYKIAPPESLSVIGSNSINTAGDLYILDLNSISKPSNQRNKRLLDICFSFFFLIFSPVLIFFYKKPVNFTRNIFRVLLGQYSWVGYYSVKDLEELKNAGIANFKKGILNPADGLKRKNVAPETLRRVSLIYAKDYRVLNDIQILFKGVKYLDR